MSKYLSVKRLIDLGEKKVVPSPKSMKNSSSWRINIFGQVLRLTYDEIYGEDTSSKNLYNFLLQSLDAWPSQGHEYTYQTIDSTRALMDWIQSCNQYVRGLRMPQLVTLHTYTWHGDVQLNKFLQEDELPEEEKVGAFLETSD